jgi:hypothetical protein
METETMNLEQTLDRLRELCTPGSIRGRCLNCVSIMRLTLADIAKNPKGGLPEFTAEEVEAEKAALLVAYPDARDCPNCALEVAS